MPRWCRLPAKATGSRTSVVPASWRDHSQRPQRSGPTEQALTRSEGGSVPSCRFGEKVGQVQIAVDTRIIRLGRKWLKSGILEDGIVTVDDRGTGQGSVISPLLANIYLHYCLDLWADRWRRREAQGDMIIVRYADDLVVGFEREDDARRFLDAMRAR